MNSPHCSSCRVPELLKLLFSRSPGPPLCHQCSLFLCGCEKRAQCGDTGEALSEPLVRPHLEKPDSTQLQKQASELKITFLQSIDVRKRNVSEPEKDRDVCRKVDVWSTAMKTSPKAGMDWRIKQDIYKNCTEFGAELIVCYQVKTQNSAVALSTDATESNCVAMCVSCLKQDRSTWMFTKTILKRETAVLFNVSQQSIVGKDTFTQTQVRIQEIVC